MAKAMHEEALPAQEDSSLPGNVLDCSPDVIVCYDTSLRRVYANRRYEVLTGLTPAQYLGRPLADDDGVDDAVGVSLARALASGEGQELEYAMRRGEGAVWWFTMRVVIRRDAEGRITGLVTFSRDITARKRLEAAWQFVTECGWGDGEAFFPALVGYLSAALGVDYVLAGRLEEDAAVVETLAFHAKGRLLPNLCYQLAGTPCETVATRNVCCYPRAVRELFADDDMLVDMEVESYAGIPLLGADGAACGLIAVMDGKPFADPQSITDLLRVVATRATAELIRERSDSLRRAREAEFRTLVEQSPDCIVRYNREGERVYANPKLLQMLQGSFPLGTKPARDTGIVDFARYGAMIDEVLASGQPLSAELMARLPNGEVQWLDMRVCPALDAEGKVESVFAIGRDVTESMALREQVRVQALTDSLTRLGNRQALYERGGEHIEEARRHGRRLGVMILDVDRFKQVNDSMGHSVGDQLLAAVAQRISECMRGHDLLVRMGGDEFAAVVTNIDGDVDVAFVATRVCNALAVPFGVGGRTVSVSASIGIAVFPDDGADLEQLLAQADGAMYQAKHAGRNRFEFHRPEFTTRAQYRLAIEQALREARDGEGLELYFQPKIRLGDDTLVGAEALLRWHHGELGLVTPDNFIPIAEETGLIVPIGRWVLRAGAETAVRWNRGREVPLRLAVNVSTRQFKHDDLLVTVRDTLAVTGCDPRWLELEVTESLLLEDDERVREVLRGLAAMGVTIAIDDFGTGYSALGYLARFEVDTLKIDRQFLRGIEHDNRQRELLKAFVVIARALGMELVAEGVESAAQASFLVEHGCDVAQGYLFGAPMPIACFETLWLTPAA